MLWDKSDSFQANCDSLQAWQGSVLIRLALQKGHQAPKSQDETSAAYPCHSLKQMGEEILLPYTLVDPPHSRKLGAKTHHPKAQTPQKLGGNNRPGTTNVKRGQKRPWPGGFAPLGEGRVQTRNQSIPPKKTSHPPSLLGGGVGQ